MLKIIPRYERCPPRTHLTLQRTAGYFARSGRPYHMTLTFRRALDVQNEECEAPAKEALECLSRVLKRRRRVNSRVGQVCTWSYQVHLEAFQDIFSSVLESVRFLRGHFGTHWGSPTVPFSNIKPIQ